MTGTLSVLSNYCCCYRCYNVTFISESRAPEHKVQLFTAHFCLDDASALQTNPFTINFSVVSAKLLFLFCRVDDSIITLLCVCVCVCMLSHFSHVGLFVMLWTVARLAPVAAIKTPL